MIYLLNQQIAHIFCPYLFFVLGSFFEITKAKRSLQFVVSKYFRFF